SLLLPVSKPKQVRNDRQPNSHHDQKDCIRYKVREGHEANAAEQGNESLLPFAVDKVSETHRAENHSPK
ncbi:MAG TPA: hypothetical protein VGA27_11280, partial [Candidatus Binatia bacterium]